MNWGREGVEYRATEKKSQPVYEGGLTSVWASPQGEWGKSNLSWNRLLPGRNPIRKKGGYPNENRKDKT